MRTILKYAAAVALTGALAVAAATPSEARHGRNAAAGIGFVAGALIGSAIVGANNGYYEPSYGYAPGYYAEPAYAYEPETVYVAPRRVYRSGDGAGNGCWHATDTTRGYGYYGACY